MHEQICFIWVCEVHELHVVLLRFYLKPIAHTIL